MKPIRTPTADDWRNWRGQFALLPAVIAFPEAAFPSSWLPWWDISDCSALLETGKAGRYTILAPGFEGLLLCEETATTLLRPSGGGIEPERVLPGAPLEVLRDWFADHRGPAFAGAPPFLGGLIGFLSYDLVRLLERLPSRTERDLEIPLAAFGICPKIYVYDHCERILFCIVNHRIPPEASGQEIDDRFNEALAEAALMKREWDSRLTAPRLPHVSSCDGAEMFSPPAGPARFSFSRDTFTAAVRRIQEYIRTGDTYQTNLSIRESRPLHVPPEAVYEKLRQINPSPYMGLLRLPRLSLVSGSPELLVRLRQGKLEARPIAGTRPRGTNASEDESLHRELLENSKERAEHLMLVDLIRNDLGRVSEFGSVRVTEFMTVENYSHVMHIVSHIEGRLPAGNDLFDAIAATFPGGTITGAPKVRTMEIIEELEPVRRGPYTGSIGWLGFSGDMELNITIRTLLAMDGKAHVQAGAGVVIDSDPEREYQESLNKARALWAAVEATEAELQVLPAQV